MNNFENLNDRVAKAVAKFQQSEEQRRSENKSLSRVLNGLEIKFEARTAELDDCHIRIQALEASNVSLTALVCQLVEIVENTASEVENDPVYRASSAASEIVERFVNDNPLKNLGVSAPAAPLVEAAVSPGASVADEPAAALSDGRFEDIEDEFRLAEDLFEKTEGAAEFPKLVYDAIALARGEEAAPVAAVDAPIDIPEPRLPESDVSVDVPAGGDLDIKEIMARLELAAERAQLRADENVGVDQMGPPTQAQARTA